VNGGPVQTICDATDGRGGTWSSDGVIVFSPDLGSPLQRVAMGGGAPTAVTKLSEDGEDHRFPEFLPDQQHFLFTLNGPKQEIIGIYAGSLDGAPPVRLLPDVSSAVYVPPAALSSTGHLLFRRENTLMAVAFDPKRLQMVGDVFPAAAEPVGVTANNAYAPFSASANGVLAHQAGNGTADHELAWMDRAGKRLRSVGKPGQIQYEALSPDEKTVAYILNDGTGRSDVWLLDIARDSPSRFSFQPMGAVTPLWSPDGSKIAYGVGPVGLITVDIFQKPASGGKEELVQRSGQVRLFDWAPDGKNVVFTPEQTVGKTQTDLFLLPMEGDHKPVPYLQTSFGEFNAQFSPDGRWMSYTTDDSGKDQVWVRPVPDTGKKYQVSTAGGTRARWSRDGKELFYISLDQKLTAVPVKTSPGFEAGSPRELFPFTPGANALAFFYTPSKDGQRFLMNVATGVTAPQPPITVVLNWQTGLKK
jgi:eukaryotic-like serine/threonine-protein kinase